MNILGAGVLFGRLVFRRRIRIFLHSRPRRLRHLSQGILHIAVDRQQVERLTIVIVSTDAELDSLGVLKVEVERHVSISRYTVSLNRYTASCSPAGIATR